MGRSGSDSGGTCIRASDMECLARTILALRTALFVLPADTTMNDNQQVSDLTETEALSFLTSAVPHLSEADAARLIILLGGRPQHLRRAAAALREEGKTVEGA